MNSRREFLQVAAATAALTSLQGLGGWSRAFAQQKLTEADLLAFEPFGNVTLVHVTDIHGQLKPVYFREPSINLGVGPMKGLPPHIVGGEFIKKYGLAPNSAEAHALTFEDFEALAKTYGRVGGLDRVATVIKAIRADRADRMLLLDGGDTWTNSFTSMMSKGQDMVDAMALLKPDAMVGHWEFTLGHERVKEIVEGLGFAFLASNMLDTEWNEKVFESTATFERGGVKIAVIGQAFPYTPIANPRWMMPNWSFGIQEEKIQAAVNDARADGAGLVVLLSHNGFDVDRKVASRVSGIDVILAAHTHDALPQPEVIGQTLLVASGSHGKFVSRLDLDVQGGKVAGYRYKLIPVFADAIKPDAEMAALIDTIRAPHEKMLSEPIGEATGLLYRRGNFNGTFDDVICDALLAERDAEIALSPGFRWGTSVLPGPITRDDVYNATAMSYPSAYRMTMTGARLREVIEDVADNLFNPDPYYQQGGDMVRIGGMGYAIDVSKPIGERISDMTVLKTGKPIEADREYVVAGWASINEDVEGPPIWDVVMNHISRVKTIEPNKASHVKVTGA